MALPDPDTHSAVRQLWVPREIDDALSGRAKFLDLADPKAGALVQRYIGGLWLRGSLIGDPKKKGPEFERLLKVDEVWVMCFRLPKFNQWRLMGRFVAHNEFVALGLYKRSFLNGDAKYQSIAERFIARWPLVTHYQAVLRGTKIADYISEPVSDSYEEIL